MIKRPKVPAGVPALLMLTAFAFLLLQTLTAAGVAGLPAWSGWAGLTAMALAFLAG